MAISEALDWLVRFMEGITPQLNLVVIFFLILFIGFLVGKILGRLTRKLLAGADAGVKRLLGWKVSVEHGAGRAVAGLIYLVSIILALNAVGLTTVVLEAILAIVILAIAVGFLLALKDIIPNAAAGITLRGKLAPGTRLRLDDAEGAVEEVTILETTIRTKKGDLIVIPNALFARQRIRITKVKA